MKQKFVVSAEYHPERDDWTGLAVHQGVSRSHPTYNVIYNGICDRECFPTEKAAKRAALKAIMEYNSTLKGENADMVIKRKRKPPPPQPPPSRKTRLSI